MPNPAPTNTNIHLDGSIVVNLNVDILNSKLDQILTQQRSIMAAIDDLKKAQAAEKADLVTLSGLLTQLLAAFAAGTITPTDAQALLDEMNAQDATVKTNIASIQSALPTPNPTPTP